MVLKSFSLNIPDSETSYIKDIPVIKSLNSKRFDFKMPVTFFVGENGSGKSTLLEALAVSVGLNAEGGSRNFIFSTKHTESNLHNFITVLVRIDELVKNNSQFIIATHSPIVLAYPNSEIYEIAETGLQKTGYKDTLIYKTVKQFVNSPEHMLDLLLH